MSRLALIAWLVIVAPASVACGGILGGSSSASPTAAPATASASPGATATVVADTRRTGLADVDAAIDAVLSGDTGALNALVQYEPVVCTAKSEGIGGPPECEGEEADGTPIDVLAVAECEGFYQRPPADLHAFVSGDERLYAVYRDAADSFLGGPYVLVFSYPAPAAQGTRWARALFMDVIGITGVHYGCAQTPEQFVTFNQLTDTVIPPQ